MINNYVTIIILTDTHLYGTLVVMGNIEEHGMGDGGHEWAETGLNKGSYWLTSVAMDESSLLVAVASRHGLCGQDGWVRTEVMGQEGLQLTQHWPHRCSTDWVSVILATFHEARRCFACESRWTQAYVYTFYVYLFICISTFIHLLYISTFMDVVSAYPGGRQAQHSTVLVDYAPVQFQTVIWTCPVYMYCSSNINNYHGIVF